MDERLGLIAQAAALRRQIAEAEVVVGDLQRDGLEVEDEVWSRFRSLIAARKRDMELLDAQIADAASLQDCWKTLRVVRDRSATLFQDCLAVVHGTLMRNTQLDRGLCQIADGLLRELSRGGNITWRRRTVLADTEFFGDGAQIIRIRYPETTIWTLPITAHEFGHFIVPRVELDRHTAVGDFDEDPLPNLVRPFQDLISKEYSNGFQWAFAHEVFADIFATYVMGIAYAYACIFLRFDPALANDRLQDILHPTPAERVYTALSTLRRTASSLDFAAAYRDRIQQLSTLWTLTTSSVLQGALPDDRAERIDSYVETFYPLVDTYFRDIRYDSFAEAMSLSAQLLTGSLSGVRPSIATVVNAAWLARLEHPDDDLLLSHIEAAAKSLCLRSASNGSVRG